MKRKQIGIGESRTCGYSFLDAGVGSSFFGSRKNYDGHCCKVSESPSDGEELLRHLPFLKIKLGESK